MLISARSGAGCCCAAAAMGNGEGRTCDATPASVPQRAKGTLERDGEDTYHRDHSGGPFSRPIVAFVDSLPRGFGLGRLPTCHRRHRRARRRALRARRSRRRERGSASAFPPFTRSRESTTRGTLCFTTAPTTTGERSAESGNGGTPNRRFSLPLVASLIHFRIIASDSEPKP